MGQTKLQKFAFTLMMCFGMVLFMTIYNMILNEGFHSNLLINLLHEFFVALICDVFIVAKIAKLVAFKIVKPNKETKQIKIILAISSCMVVGMVLCMSVFGSIVAVGFNVAALKIYPMVVLRNFVMALPLNLLVVSPTVRFLFGMIFKEEKEEKELNIAKEA